MSPSTTQPASPKPSPSKKRILIVVVSAAVVLVLAAVIGPMIYARSQSAAPAPLSVSAAPTSTNPSAADENTPAASTAADDGAWKVGDGSEAGYRVDEVLNGQDVTVVGRTDEVSGSVQIAGDQLTEAEIVVDVASVETDSDRRDNYFRETAMKVGEHETATFTLTEPVALPTIGADPVEVKATGTLELAGESRPVTASIAVARDGAAVKTSGTIDVTFSEWGIDAPNLGFVKVEDAGQVEFLVQLEQ